MHYLRNDTRKNILFKLIKPFKEYFDEINIASAELNHRHWDDLYADDTEHIFGTAFIVFQNYINTSINDLYPELKDIHVHYKSDVKIAKSNTSRIQLIIAIANYYKHRDLPGELRKNTKLPFEDLGIEYKVVFLESDEFFHSLGSDSPVFQGLELLSESWDLYDIIKIVTEWRENLWLLEEQNN